MRRPRPRQQPARPLHHGEVDHGALEGDRAPAPGDRLLECEAGALNGDVQAEAAKHGLFWAPDPTSLAYSTVGGNLGCCAGGPRAVKYGTARDNVLGLRAVGPDDSFTSLGGDSMSYVEASVGLERILGHLPADWPTRPLAALAAAQAPPAERRPVAGFGRRPAATFGRAG